MPNPDTADIWGNIMKLAEKVSAESDRLDWSELADMVADALDSEDKNQDNESLFFGIYQYMYRLLLRVRHYMEKQPFNKIYTTTKWQKHEPVPYIRIVNYDYKTYKWAREHRQENFLDNNMIEMPESLFSEKQLASLKAKALN